MLSRRALILAAGTLPLAACGGGDAYARATAETWRLPPGGADFPAHALIHAATLAANSHNTQPWRFAVDARQVRIAPDFSRRTPVVDPDDHHLFVSLGCAAETMLQAAPAYGWRGEIQVIDPRRGITLAFVPGAPVARGLALAIPHRASTRADYDGRAVPAPRLRALAAVGGPQVDIALITDPRRLRQATDFIVRGNAAQVGDRSFRQELKSWIRFDAAEALARRDGLFAAASGSPTAPRFVGERLFELAFTEKAETDKVVRQMRSSAGLAVFTSHEGGHVGWVEAGRAFTRFALQATAARMKLAFLNQPVEDAPSRTAFAGWLGSRLRPDLVVRFGYGPDMPRSLRRAGPQVMVA